MTAAGAAALALPPVPHLPGRTPRPDEAVFEALKATIPAELGAEALRANPAYLAGFEAFRARYYWEAHELWEAVWIALPPAGAERCLLRGLIQLANAGLKTRMGRPAAARRILALADAALAEAARRGAAPRPAAAPGLRAQVETDSAADDAL